MKITDLFSVVLPEKKISLDDRVTDLQKKGIAFAIYASNFIPFQLKVTVDGARQLAVVEFEKHMSAEEAHFKIRRIRQYKEALIEDFLALIGDQRLIDDENPGIVCVGARFDSISVSLEGDKVTPYMATVLEEGEKEGDPKKKVRSVGLAPEDASFNAGVRFLLVKEEERRAL